MLEEGGVDTSMLHSATVLGDRSRLWHATRCHTRLPPARGVLQDDGVTPCGALLTPSNSWTPFPGWTNVGQKSSWRRLALIWHGLRPRPVWRHGPAWPQATTKVRGSSAPAKPARAVLTQLAHAAVRTKGTNLSALYRHLAARRGKQRAIMAVAHSIMRSVLHMLSRNAPYRELGGLF